MAEKPRLDLVGLTLESAEGYVLTIHGNCPVRGELVEIMYTYRGNMCVATRPADIDRKALEADLRTAMASIDQDSELSDLVGQEV